MRALLFALAVTQVTAFPVPADSSCEGMLFVESRELDFMYSEATPMDGEQYRIAQHGIFRNLAHATAVAQCGFEYAQMHSCEAGTPPRTRVVLSPGSMLQGADSAWSTEGVPDANAAGIVQRCSQMKADSSCVLWTCEIGRYRTESGAQVAAAHSQPPTVEEAGEWNWDPERDARFHYATCGGTWEPGSFVVRLRKAAVAPWSVRFGLYFTRGDAERAARAMQPQVRLHIRVVRQRVDGPLLEEALRAPVEDC
jgi:hypothetical protein